MTQQYFFSPTLATFANLAVRRMQDGRGAVLLLTGIPGGGKTEFAKAVATTLDAQFFKYQCAPDRERDLLYHIDVDGVLKRDNAWLPGPAWEAFEASKSGYVVLLIDEVDKTHPNFDAFLLELLESFQFRAPGNGYIKGDPSKLLVILTSNGRRQLRPEVLRRSQRISVPFPERERLEKIVLQVVGESYVPKGLLDLVIRLGDNIRKLDPETGPSPKEMGLCIVDILQLSVDGEFNAEIWREVAASYLIKEGSVQAIDKAANFKWAKALIAEARKGE